MIDSRSLYRSRVAILTLATATTLTLAAFGCAGGESARPEAHDAGRSDAGQSTAAPEVTYEPAYPADVSEEDLSAADAGQQTVTHSHGGEEHSHGEDDHTHDEGHAHDDGDASDDDGGSDDEHGHGV
jgi:hypothetical protein